MDDTYARILCNIDERHYQYAFKILQWLAYSARPLKLTEIAEVVAINVEEDPRFDPDKRLLDPRDILRICFSLISLEDQKLSHWDNEDNTVIVRLAHFSVKEYLFSERILQGKAKRYRIEDISANQLISYDCIAYLLQLDNLILLNNQVLTRFPLAIYAAQYWTQHARVVERYSGFDPYLATELFLSKGFGLLNWIRLSDPDEKHGGQSLRKHPSIICSPLYYASMAGLYELVQILLENEVDVNTQGGKYGNALQAASYKGYDRIVQTLLETKVIINKKGGEYSTTLLAASRWGHDKVVLMLLEKGANVYAKDQFYGNALHTASKWGHETVVQILLKRGTDVNAQNGKYGNALQAASYRGHDRVVQMLLEKGADVNAQGGEYSTALHAASRWGHDKVVQILLEKGADVNTQVGEHGNALYAASELGHDRVVQILLEKGADVNAWGGRYDNALSTASSSGHNRVVQILLERGADVNAQGGYYGNALQAARGHEKVVQMLLEKGADIDT